MKLVVIGNGVAAITTARSVASANPSTDVVIYTAERYPYYPRPRLVDFLAGATSDDEMPQYVSDWYVQRGIQVEYGSPVAAINPDQHQIVLRNDETVVYDKLVLATGARSFVPPIPGVERRGVYSLRTLDDALVIKQRIAQARHAVLLGGGLLGLDTAMALRANGLAVTVLEMQPWLLPRQLDEQGASLLRYALEDRGLEIVTGDVCASLDGAESVESVRCKSGLVIDADLVVVSAGVRSNIKLAQDAGLACQRGIIVDDTMRTSHPDVFAAGDCAEFEGIVWGIIPAALAQARVVAAQLSGDETTRYEQIVPSTTLQVTGIDLTSLGEVNPEGDGFRQVRHEDRERSIYKKLVVRDGRIVGAVLLGDRRDARAVSQLIGSGTDVTAHIESLLDEDFDLSALAKAAS